MIYLFLFLAGIGASILFSERNLADMDAKVGSPIVKEGSATALQSETENEPIIVYMRQGIHVSGEMEFQLKQDRLLLEDQTTQYVIPLQDIVHISIDPLTEENTKESVKKRRFYHSISKEGYYVAIAYRNTAKKFKLVTLHFPKCSAETLEKLNHIV